jgi:hypothetical protein
VTAAEEPSVAPSDTAQELAREVYWARGGGSFPPADPGSIRGRLEDFAHRRRVDHGQVVPNDDALLVTSSAWKRAFKTGMWRASRFSTMRYDRLLAELAELNGELAARLASTEEEVARLREELARRRDEEP